jgi:hypothetical protein
LLLHSSSNSGADALGIVSPPFFFNKDLVDKIVVENSLCILEADFFQFSSCKMVNISARKQMYVVLGLFMLIGIIQKPTFFPGRLLGKENFVSTKFW